MDIEQVAHRILEGSSPKKFIQGETVLGFQEQENETVMIPLIRIEGPNADLFGNDLIQPVSSLDFVDFGAEINVTSEPKVTQKGGAMAQPVTTGEKIAYVEAEVDSDILSKDGKYIDDFEALGELEEMLNKFEDKGPERPDIGFSIPYA